MYPYPLPLNQESPEWLAKNASQCILSGKVVSVSKNWIGNAGKIRVFSENLGSEVTIFVSRFRQLNEQETSTSIRGSEIVPTIRDSGSIPLLGGNFLEQDISVGMTIRAQVWKLWNRYFLQELHDDVIDLPFCQNSLPSNTSHFIFNEQQYFQHQINLLFYNKEISEDFLIKVFLLLFLICFGIYFVGKKILFLFIKKSPKV